MGAWDIGPFGNDGALDALGDLDGAADLEEAMASAMREILDEPGYLESPELSGAIAVACLVGARILGEERDSVAAKWLAANSFAATADLRQAALAVLDRATTKDDNEVYELWEDAGAQDEWLATLVPYRQALTS
ncbi:DUF4259 domain-containing protein [Nonomuraea sp. NPDC050556]|uniref:DUF4259 domain-containing protein n=1 Tax=Nonomuraea sp. NPDC050556 TaxID=3364369 RepID=UPI0037B7E2C8